MPSFNSQTLSVAANTGYVITLTNEAGIVDVASRVNCWVRVASGGLAPTAPVVSPAPSVGTLCNYVYIMANEKASYGVDFAYTSTGFSIQDRTKYVVIWAEAAGFISVVSH